MSEQINEFLERFAAVQREVEQIKKQAEKDKKARGRPSNAALASQIVAWMPSCFTAFKGTNKALYVIIKHPIYTEYNRTISLNELNESDQKFHDIVNVIYTREMQTASLTPAVWETACEMFLSNARVHAPTYPVAIRIARSGDDSKAIIYIDRGTADESERYIKITREKVTVGSDNGGFYFIHEGNTAELPKPDINYNYNMLHPMLNLTQEDTQIIFLWYLHTILPVNAYVNLLIQAPKGSGKSVLVAYLRSIIDPHPNFFTEMPLPDKLIDFMVKSSRTHILSYDNLTNIPDWFSDTVCRVSKGTEIAVKTLYTTTGLTEIYTKNPLIFSGINITPFLENDLLRRSLTIKLPGRPRNSSTTERRLKRRFDTIHPQILGALCNAVKGALNHIDSIRETHLNDMAEFHRWSIAAGLSLGWSEDTVDELIAKYQDHKREFDMLHNSEFLEAIEILLAYTPNNEFHGTPTKLLSTLRTIRQHSAPDEPLPRDFPSDPTRCVKQLKGALEILHNNNIIVLFNTNHTVEGNMLYMKLVKSPEEIALSNYEQETVSEMVTAEPGARISNFK
jgi:hypothetical protein